MQMQQDLSAVLLQQVPGSFGQIISLGGPVTLVLLLLSVAALSIVLVKAVQLFAERSRNRDAIHQALLHWQNGKQKDAIAGIVHAERGVASLLRVAMQGSLASAVSEAQLREELQRLASADMQRLRSHLRTLEVIATISPLLGLFGTVLGMIEAFRQMEQAGSRIDPSILSGGIWQALLTTGVGLAVAIPATLAHQWLDRRAEHHAHRMEDTVTQVFTATVRQRTQPAPMAGTDTLDAAG
ncbi:MotA/TolQ/ExbB proton channel family protein [Granulosicoccus sp. 3-233]|uniref:MotA/TolQ/ExbB proton channel family protein n=1 Tax=Granulosicoccus sp. 3-233 TaxID=3417969 RepID=UPI003D32A4B8